MEVAHPIILNQFFKPCYSRCAPHEDLSFHRRPTAHPRGIEDGPPVLRLNPALGKNLLQRLGRRPHDKSERWLDSAKDASTTYVSFEESRLRNSFTNGVFVSFFITI